MLRGEVAFEKDGIFDGIIFQFIKEKEYNIRKYVANGNDTGN